MLIGQQLIDVLKNTVTSRPVRNTFLRATPLRYSHDPLGKNRPINAMRFNIAHGARVLYVGDTLQTCAAETQAVGFPSPSTTFIQVQVSLQAVIDLRDAVTLKALKLTLPELALNFRLQTQPTPTQQLGEACVQSGVVDGIFYDSLTPAGGLCLAIIEGNLRAGASWLKVSDPANKLFAKLP